MFFDPQLVGFENAEAVDVEGWLWGLTSMAVMAASLWG